MSDKLENITTHILVDTRQQKNKHGFKHAFFEKHNIEIYRSKLPVGDYMIPGGKSAVATKASILELANNLRQDHVRFRNECELSQKLGIQLYILIENPDGVKSLQDLSNWVEPINSFYIRKTKNKNAKRIYGKQLARAASTMSKKYGVLFGFCTALEAGRRVIEILENHEKKRMEAIISNASQNK